MSVSIHETAIIEDDVSFGEGTKVWHFTQIRRGATLGSNCIIGGRVFIDLDVKIGSQVKIQNNSLIYHGVEIKDGVFIGPNVIFTNDKIPRAINHDGSLKDTSDWKVGNTIVGEGASIGAGSVILPGLNIGKFALIGSGSVVTKKVGSYELWYGNPAKKHGYVCKCGTKLKESCSICGIKLGDLN